MLVALAIVYQLIIIEIDITIPILQQRKLRLREEWWTLLVVNPMSIPPFLSLSEPHSQITYWSRQGERCPIKQKDDSPCLCRDCWLPLNTIMHECEPAWERSQNRSRKPRRSRAQQKDSKNLRYKTDQLWSLPYLWICCEIINFLIFQWVSGWFLKTSQLM